MPNTPLTSSAKHHDCDKPLCYFCYEMRRINQLNGSYQSGISEIKAYRLQTRMEAYFDAKKSENNLK